MTEFFKQEMLVIFLWQMVKLKKWFPRLNHFYVQINKGHLRKDGVYSSQNVVL